MAVTLCVGTMSLCFGKLLSAISLSKRLSSDFLKSPDLMETCDQMAAYFPSGPFLTEPTISIINSSLYSIQ